MLNGYHFTCALTGYRLDTESGSFVQTDHIHLHAKSGEAYQQCRNFLGDIAVVCMKPDHGKRIAHQLQSLDIPHLLMNERSGKRTSASPARSPPVLCLASCSLASLPFIGLGQIESSETQAAQKMKLLNVGMTRAKERLLITASGRNEFTERLKTMPEAVCAVA